MKAPRLNVGLELHVVLATESKLFCPCPRRAGGAPNEDVCPTCAGLPGGLPVMNERAVELAALLALALDMDLAERSGFDRKHYLYADLPKGYQITQDRVPLATGGALCAEGAPPIRLARLHLEEDAGRSRHLADRTLVDLGRAGQPLVELVTVPARLTPPEAADIVRFARELVRWLDVSDGDMEKGSLRVDVNVSLADAPGYRVELKNLNSLRHVRDALAFEGARLALHAEHGAPSETRSWNAESGASEPMRMKERRADYRFLPEPDLPELVLDAADLDRARSGLPELPDERRARFVHGLGLTQDDARLVTEERALADLFEALAAALGDAHWAARFVLHELRPILRSAGLTAREGHAAPIELAEVARRIAHDELPGPAARRALERLVRTGGTLDAALIALGLAPVALEDLESLCRTALEKRPDVVRAVREGREAALDACIGPVLTASAGAADPRVVRRLLARLVADSTGSGT